MTASLDHVFVLTSPGAAEADRLVTAGFVEGPANSHPGQGTANRRFFFSNMMLEFLFVKDAQESLQGASKRLGFIERTSSTTASPFGFVFRTIDSQPFTGWRYAPEYLPPDVSLYVSDNSTEEPLCFCMPAGLEKQNPKTVAGNSEDLVTSLQLNICSTAASDALSFLSSCRPIEISKAPQHSLKIVLNEGR